MKKKLIIIIGGCGFLGKSLMHYGREHPDWKIVTVDTREATESFCNQFNRDPKEWPENINISLDLTKDSLTEFWKKSGVNEELFNTPNDFSLFSEMHIFHFASPVGVTNHSESTFYKAMAINQNVFEFSNFYLKNKIGDKIRLNFWYASTSELYGLYDMTKKNSTEDTEDINLHTFFNRKENLGGFRSDYIYQKLLGENLFKQLGSSGFSVKILRLFNIVGEYQDPKKGVFPKFVDAIIYNKPVSVTQGIRCYTRAYTFYEMILDIMYAPRTEVGIFNIVERFFKNSLTSEELYIYLLAYIKRKFPNLEVTGNYKIEEIPNEIKVRGSHDTLSYHNFCKKFGGTIDKMLIHYSNNCNNNGKIK